MVKRVYSFMLTYYGGQHFTKLPPIKWKVKRLLPIKLKFQFCMFAGKVNHRLFISFVNVIERFSVVVSFLHMHIDLYKDK